MRNTTFGALAVGSRFEFRGQRYTKLALSMAQDEMRSGTIFQVETEVEAVDVPDHTLENGKSALGTNP